ncbi:MAG: bifunctional UDP-3-O-[3-hydroxymyristoyl] N-acetylglucosamine deacetylase/3-hydroxyacyl-ACP dehydratase [Prolixibacteraceae bacterium]|jgi:UDP-3-O-[3-hydroxymyristoyl] N-acetylglucosamine deacetylase / 3-hydroxyacyl-[acyl-carrier-protein] dehydratase|nr:bifunctional UDP-3-O-[3-hydroxymyristoyl] N-acetylglucosamine deacetylase/3-hydroxyacyl-ACP dehydratase [Prolixibacteraceae bacterium]MBT6763003.1 bifunctional UDP-3-O-[3-hydroxymyristoyl] N-acetylglucosamine deacetylase/3-hydroxyacyl-ACP dehydratase [Prolixibacteraceae bacterium]MBT6997504.1 bifunctional UDP-3-O-[3-hydroxymyristoyl] N-acetylglucosamine deacetylase/3-hydroxyacyl-ACP dehydratase [Prolixibacteraceae bacterium]MBT7394602.1 bifunctional UDP-3-O-[3-hydroxymyristoyl] N-acetylglucos
MVIKQKTLANSFIIEGKGLHTGVNVTMNFLPAPENHGFKFKRVDLENHPLIEADADFVIDTSRGTMLEKNGARIGTIEHTLAALVGMDLDNVLIEVNNEEAPIIDGSSKYFVEGIEKAGIVEQNAEREFFEIKEKIQFNDEKSGAEIIALPDDDYRLNVMISFKSKVLNNQFANLQSINNFKEEIANCRTFVFLHEIEYLLNNNLIKGGDIDNAIVIIDKEVNQEELDRLADLFQHERVEVKPQGILNNLDLHFDNECARHKLLDVIGDLALCGKRIKGRIIATKPGHGPNTMFAKVLKKAYKKTIDKAPVYNPEIPPLMDVNRIKELLPHRYPFLMVDKVISITENEIVGIKNVSTNEPFFQGHFPAEPVMPGVLMVEAMAQTGGLLVLNQQEGKFLTYFIRIDNVKFRKKVVPGDTLIFKLTLTSPIRRGIANVKGVTYVGSKVVAEGEFMAQIVKQTEN